MLVKTLRQRHPERTDGELAEHRTLYEGGPRWRELLSVWLPQQQAEGDSRNKASFGSTRWHRVPVSSCQGAAFTPYGACGYVPCPRILRFMARIEAFEG